MYTKNMQFWGNYPLGVNIQDQTLLPISPNLYGLPEWRIKENDIILNVDPSDPSTTGPGAASHLKCKLDMMTWKSFSSVQLSEQQV